MLNFKQYFVEIKYVVIECSKEKRTKPVNANFVQIGDDLATAGEHTDGDIVENFMSKCTDWNDSKDEIWSVKEDSGNSNNEYFKEVRSCKCTGDAASVF